MVYISYIPIDNLTAEVTAIIYNPFPEQITDQGLYVETIPEPESHTGMVPILYVNLETKELYYHYVKAPPSPPSGETLAGKVDELNTTMGTLLLESANDKATIASLEDTVGSLLLEVAALKGGAE